MAGASAAVVLWATTPQGNGETQGSVLIRKGRTPLAVLNELKEKQFIQNPKAIHWLGRATRQWGRMKAGEYQMSSQFTPWQVLQTLTSGQSIEHTLTIREGQNFYEVADELEQRGLMLKSKFIERCRSAFWVQRMAGPTGAPSIDGYLYPDTYRLTRVMDADDIISIFVKRFELAWKKEWNSRATELGLTRHQVVTLASIVEKETGHGPERPQISAVFHNRLKKRMPLQSDPTTIYGIWERWNGNLRKSDLQEKTPWNTYAIPSLPIGAIGNPGEEALRAALYPASNDFLYFVSKNDGTHAFTRSYADHLNEVRRFQLNAKAREGRSWRELSEKAGKAEH
jgi:UPF0755 protein